MYQGVRQLYQHTWPSPSNLVTPLLGTSQWNGGIMIFVTCATPDYPRPWIFPSLGMLSCPVKCLLDADDKRPLPVNVLRINYRPRGCAFQAGDFLSSLGPLPDDELVVLADCDAVVQRDFNWIELAFLS